MIALPGRGIADVHPDAHKCCVVEVREIPAGLAGSSGLPNGIALAPHAQLDDPGLPPVNGASALRRPSQAAGARLFGTLDQKAINSMCCQRATAAMMITTGHMDGGRSHMG